jgi:hypothetical protein
VLWHAGSAEAEGSNFRSLVQGFADLGYVDGRNIVLEHRFPDEVPEQFRSMAADLVSANVDVLIGVGNNAAPYAKGATTTIPVVFMLVSDPVGAKLVDSLRRPGGNTTGISNSAADLIGKRLELLKEIIPGLSRVALLINSDARISRLYVAVAQAAAAALGLTSLAFEWRVLDELRPAFDAMVRAGAQALLTNPDGLAFTHRVDNRQVGPRASPAVIRLVERDLCGGRAHVLWRRRRRDLSSCGRLRRQNNKGCQTQRSSCRATDKVRAAHQRQDRPGRWPSGPRGDRAHAPTR